MKRITGLMAAGLVALGLSGCGDATSTAPTAKPTPDLTVVCVYLRDFAPQVLKPLADGTMTSAEAVTKLGDYQGKFDGEVLLFKNAGESDMAAKYGALSLAIGHLKVAESTGDTTAINAAIAEMSTATTALPNCPA